MRRLAVLLLSLALLAGCTATTPTPTAPRLVHTGGPVVATPATPPAAFSPGTVTPGGAAPVSGTPVTAAPSGCRTGNPLANVYHAYRLVVLAPCAIVTGTVVLEHNDEADGDFHINVRLDPQYAGLINAENTTQEGGDLVVEVVPADQPGCVVGQPPKPPSGTYDYGRCTGADIPSPPIGAHIRVVGPWVLDTDHGWREIHPAWSITALGGVAQPAVVPAVPPSVAVPTSTQPPGGAAAPTAPPSGGSATVTFTAVQGGNPGGTASVSVTTVPDASCAISYVTPAGTRSKAAGLAPEDASSAGAVSWSWRIGSSTRPGTGRVTVTCDGVSRSTPITVG